MMALVGLLAGIVVGSTPTAEWLARWRGVDLREEGSGNPGANNAFQLGGPVLGAVVLVVEVGKGLAAVWLGAVLGGAPAAATGGIGATLGNIYNPWYRLQGGKGLAVTGGTLVAAWPALAGMLVAVLGATVAVLRRSGPSAITALLVYVVVASMALAVPLPGRWAVPDPGWLWVMAVVQALAMAPKHYLDAVRRPGRRGSRGGS